MMRRDLLILQSPWIPVQEEHVETMVSAIREKNIAVRRMVTYSRIV